MYPLPNLLMKCSRSLSICCDLLSNERTAILSELLPDTNELSFCVFAYAALLLRVSRLGAGIVVGCGGGGVNWLCLLFLLFSLLSLSLSLLCCNLNLIHTGHRTQHVFFETGFRKELTGKKDRIFWFFFK